MELVVDGTLVKNGKIGRTSRKVTSDCTELTPGTAGGPGLRAFMLGYETG